MFRKILVFAALGTLVVAPNAFARRGGGLFGAIGKAVSSTRSNARPASRPSVSVRPRYNARRGAVAGAAAVGAGGAAAYAAQGTNGVSAPDTMQSPYGTQGIPPRPALAQNDTLGYVSTTEAAPRRLLAAAPRRANAMAAPIANNSADATSADAPLADSGAEVLSSSTTTSTLPNSGGSPFLVSVSGLILAFGALILRRKFAI